MKLNGIELLNLAVAHELREVWVVRLDPPDQPGNRGQMVTCSGRRFCCVKVLTMLLIWLST